MTMTARRFLPALEVAARTKGLVRISRRHLEHRPLDAFVVALSEELVLLQTVRDRLDFDGYDVIRLRDVTQVASSPKERLVREALRLKRLRPRKPQRSIDLTSMATAMASADRAYPPIVINRERAAKGECEIGRVSRLTAKSYSLNWLSPNARFEDDCRDYKVADVTLLQFCGEYEQTLGLVAGMIKKARTY